jgi:glycerol-3-phosphate dehydrogenase
VDYLIDHEWAMSLEDVIWRRTKHGLRLSQSEQANLESYITAQVSKSSDMQQSA